MPNAHSHQDPFQYGGEGFRSHHAIGMDSYYLKAPIIRPRQVLSDTESVSWLKQSDQRFSIKGDYETLLGIISDMEENAGEFEPIAHWHVSNAGLNDGSIRSISDTKPEVTYQLTRDDFQSKYSTLDRLLDPYVGITGMQPTTSHSVDQYARYLHAIDHLNLSGANLQNTADRLSLLTTDLGSIIDANYCLGYPHYRDVDRVRILEIGGGYGRLAEVLHNVLRGKCHHVLVDSVPATLMYAYRYLSRRLPGARIGSYYNGDAYDSSYDVYVMPSWKLHDEHLSEFDIAVSVEAFQEMNEVHVANYLQMMTDAIGLGGVLYLSNSWQYLYRGSYPIPVRFETVWLANSPRSWTTIHPVHVLIKGGQNDDFTMNNTMMLSQFGRYESGLG